MLSRRATLDAPCSPAAPAEGDGHDGGAGTQGSRTRARGYQRWRPVAGAGSCCEPRPDCTASDLPWLAESALARRVSCHREEHAHAAKFVWSDGACHDGRRPGELQPLSPLVRKFPLCSRCILQVGPDLPRGRVYPQVQPCATRSLNQCRRKEGAHLVVLANA